MKQNPPKVAIIDSEIQILELLRELFQSGGFQPAVFQSGKEALQQFPSIQPDVVLLEIALPEEDGFGVCSAIHERFPEIPIFVLSNMREPESRLKAIERGAVDYLTKPYDRDYLVKKVRNLLNLLKNPSLKRVDESHPVLKIFSEGSLPVLKPEPNSQSPFGYSYPLLKTASGIENPDEQAKVLEDLVAQNRLTHAIFDVVRQCPKCHSINVNYRPVCPDCLSPAIRLIPAHGKSARQPYQEKTYECSQCHSSFSTPGVYGRCLNCSADFEESESKTRLVYSYALQRTEKSSGFHETKPEPSILKSALQESDIDFFEPFVLDILAAYEMKQVKASSRRAFSVLKIEFQNLSEFIGRVGQFTGLRTFRNFFLIVRKILRLQDQVILGEASQVYILMPDTNHAAGSLIKKQLASYIGRFNFDLTFTLSLDTFPKTFQAIEALKNSGSSVPETQIQAVN